MLHVCVARAKVRGKHFDGMLKYVMCGRYSIGSPEEVLKKYDHDKNLKLKPSYNIAPDTVNPVVAVRSPAKIYLMRWGLIPSWVKDLKGGYSMINARAEGIEAKPAYRKPIRSQRCLVPATGFYEWKKLKLEKNPEKVPWYLKVKNQELFFMAGVYDVWKAPDGRELLTYSIITTTPNKLMSNIHDRMPVILEDKNLDEYLDPKTPLEDILKLLKPFPDSKMEGWPVSREVNSPKNNFPDLINKA